MSLCLSNGTKRCLNCWHAAPAGWSCPIYSFPVSLLCSWWVWWTRRPRLRPASLTHSRSLSSPLRGRVQPLQSSRGPATRHSLRALGMNIFPKIRGKRRFDPKNIWQFARKNHLNGQFYQLYLCSKRLLISPSWQDISPRLWRRLSHHPAPVTHLSAPRRNSGRRKTRLLKLLN